MERKEKLERGKVGERKNWREEKLESKKGTQIYFTSKFLHKNRTRTYHKNHSPKSVCTAEIENYSFTLPLFMEQNLMNLKYVFVDSTSGNFIRQPLLVRQE